MNHNLHAFAGFIHGVKVLNEAETGGIVRHEYTRLVEAGAVAKGKSRDVRNLWFLEDFLSFTILNPPIIYS